MSFLLCLQLIPCFLFNPRLQHAPLTRSVAAMKVEQTTFSDRLLLSSVKAFIDRSPTLKATFCAGLLVLLHHELTMKAPLPWRVQVHVPVRKRVQCRTRDLHQSLLVKLNRAQLQATSPQATPVSSPAPAHAESSVEAVCFSAQLHVQLCAMRSSIVLRAIKIQEQHEALAACHLAMSSGNSGHPMNSLYPFVATCYFDYIRGYGHWQESLCDIYRRPVLINCIYIAAG